MTFKDMIWPFLVFSIYITGGILTFSGFALILFMKGKDLWGWGEGHTVGYMFVFTGFLLSIFGVLIMRILRNRM